MVALLGRKSVNLSKSGKSCRYATLQHHGVWFRSCSSTRLGVKNSVRVSFRFKSADQLWYGLGEALFFQSYIYPAVQPTILKRSRGEGVILKQKDPHSHLIHLPSQFRYRRASNWKNGRRYYLSGASISESARLLQLTAGWISVIIKPYWAIVAENRCKVRGILLLDSRECENTTYDD